MKPKHFLCFAVLAAMGSALGLAQDHHGHDHAGHDHATPAAPAQPAQNGQTPAAPADGKVPLVELSTLEWNFGTAMAGQPLTTDVTVKNVGDAPLTVEVKVTCGCTQVKAPKSPLAPGESDTFTIGYDSKRIGKVSKVVRVLTNDPVRPELRFTLTGEVKAIVEMDPPHGALFARITRNTHSSKAVEIRNTLEEPMDLKIADAPTDSFTYNLETVDPGRHYRLTVTTKPPMTDGPKSVDVKLSTGLSKAPEIVVKVSAVVQPNVVVRPDTIFLPKRLTREMTRKIYVEFPKDKPVNVTKVSGSIESIKADISPDNPYRGRPDDVFDQVEISVTLPAGKDLPPEGAIVTIETDSLEPEYAKFQVKVTNESPNPVGSRAMGHGRPTPQPFATPAAPKDDDKSAKPETASPGR